MGTDHHQHEEANLSMLASLSLNSSDYPGNDSAAVPTSPRTALKVVFPVIFLLSFAANVVVFVAVVLVHRSRTPRRLPIDVLAISVTVADLWLLFPVGFSFYAAVRELTDVQPQLWCRFFGSLDYSLQLLIALHYAAISVERYRSTDSAFRGDHTKTRDAKIVVLVFWAVGLSAFLVFGHSVPDMEYSNAEVACIASVADGAAPASLRRLVYIHAFVIVVCVVLTVGFTAVLAWKIRKYERLRHQLTDKGGPVKMSPPPSPNRGTELMMHIDIFPADRDSTPAPFSTSSSFSAPSPNTSIGPVTRSHTRNANSPVLELASPSSSTAASTHSTPLSCRARERFPEPELMSVSLLSSPPATPHPPGMAAQDPGLQAAWVQSPPAIRKNSCMAAWVTLFLTMLLAAGCLLTQAFANLAHYVDPEVFGDTYALASRMVFYEIGLISPLILVLYLARHFKILPGCRCWYCQILGFWSFTWGMERRSY